MGEFLLALAVMVTGVLLLRGGIEVVCWVQDRRLARHATHNPLLTPDERHRVEQAGEASQVDL